MRTVALVAGFLVLLLPGCIAPSEHHRVVNEVRETERGAAEREQAEMRRRHAADLERVQQDAREKAALSQHELEAVRSNLEAAQKDRDDWKSRADRQADEMAAAIADAVERGIAIGLRRRGVEALASFAQDSLLLLAGMGIGGALLLYSWVAGHRARLGSREDVSIAHGKCSSVPPSTTFYQETPLWSPRLSTTP